MDGSFFLGEDEGQQGEEKDYSPNPRRMKGLILLTPTTMSGMILRDPASTHIAQPTRTQNHTIPIQTLRSDNHPRRSATTQKKTMLKSTSVASSTYSTQICLQRNLGSP